MRKVLVAFLLSFLAVCAGNSMEGSKGSVQDNVPMTFVLGTDKNYIVPTLVTIHSLLKNGIKDEPINVIVLAEKLSKDDKVFFNKIIDEIFINLKKSNKQVKLYFLDVPQLDEKNPWNSAFGDVGKKLVFYGKNINEKGLIKYKVLLPFYLGNYGAMHVWDRETNSLSVPGLKSSDNVNISHYMWLDSDILITQNISQLYKSCLGSGSGICSSNYYFLTHDLTHFCKGFFGGIGSIDVERIDIENEGPPTFPWRFSGGVLFFNLKNVNVKSFFDYYNRNNMGGTIDDETFFGLCCRKGYFGKGVFSFSPRYNCRPSMPEAAKKTSGELEKKKTTVPAELEKITNTKEIAIWHWDGMRKPWQKMYGGFPLIAGKVSSSAYDGLMDADRQWIEEYKEVRLIIKQLKHWFSACLYNFEQMAGKNS